MRMSQAGVAASAARIVTLLACALFGLVGQIHAQTAEIVSSYTSTTEKACKAVDSKGDPDDDGFVHVCPGIGSLIVLNSEGDLRETVSVG
ncbi:hypothetical protein, partial [Klebsiella variicola]|uniref:hypothetical protein n=1 Tax=Klebsiella variicola TaxID=244366 RepID=UPI0027319159